MIKPDRVRLDIEKFPAALEPLCKVAHWVIWKLIERKGRWTKPPYMATWPERPAKNNDPKTWASFDAAIAGTEHADGIGFALLDTPFVAIDLDHCLAGDEIDPWARA